MRGRALKHSLGPLNTTTTAAQHRGDGQSGRRECVSTDHAVLVKLSLES